MIECGECGNTGWLHILAILDDEGVEPVDYDSPCHACALGRAIAAGRGA